MKKAVLIIAALMSSSLALAKGGDHFPIPQPDIGQVLKASQQVQVVIADDSHSPMLVEAIDEFQKRLNQLSPLTVTGFQLKKTKTSGEFCITKHANVTKPRMLQLINDELTLYPGHLIDISVNASLRKPCD